MGNTNSTLNSSGSSSNGNNNSNSNGSSGNNASADKYKVQIVNLEGRYHVDFKNRNLKKLKPKIFSGLYNSGIEIILPDALNNSDYMKNKNTNNSVVFKSAVKDKDSVCSAPLVLNIPLQHTNSASNVLQHTNSSNNINNNSNSKSPVWSPASSPSSSVIKKAPSSSSLLNHGATSNNNTTSNNSNGKDEGSSAAGGNTSSSPSPSSLPSPRKVNNSFLESSPVATPSSSPSSKLSLVGQLNPEFDLDQLDISTVDNNGNIVTPTPLSLEEPSTNNNNNNSNNTNNNSNNSNSNNNNNSTNTTTTAVTTTPTIKSVNKSNETNTTSKDKIANGKSNESTGSPASPPVVSTTTISNSINLNSSSKSKNKKQQQKEKEVLTLPLVDGKPMVIHSLDLSLNRLETIPAEILNTLAALQLEELSIGTNFFTQLPDITLIKSLRTLNFTRNKINRFPVDILSELPLLENLTLDKNSITAIPEDIDKLRNLKYISMRNNSLETIPNRFCNLQFLISIDFSHNKLKALPSNFDQLTSLKSLWLASNYLTTLPSMKGLFNLCTIDLSSNKLTALSRDFALLAPRSKELLSRYGVQVSNQDGTIYNFTEGSLKDINVRDNRDITILPAEFKMVEETLTTNSSLPSEIIPNVYLGGLDSANNSAILQALGITHVVLAIGDLTPYFPKNFKYYTIDDARDTPNYDLSTHFDQTTAFIEQGRKVGGVLVHCRAGISRSSTIIIAYLMRYHQLTFRSAFTYVQSKRPQIQPNAGFKEQLLKYENKLEILMSNQQTR